MNRVEIAGKSFEFGLISRRSINNAGTRFNVRGVDEEGHVANFVETEQILNYQDVKCSYVQVNNFEKKNIDKCIVTGSRIYSTILVAESQS